MNVLLCKIKKLRCRPPIYIRCYYIYYITVIGE
nr:MAG TPA: hypothetical protein [Caudoviricetes sp.]